jgi:hypothetical protein
MYTIINNSITKFCLLGVFLIAISGCLPISLGGIGVSTYQQQMIKSKVNDIDNKLVSLKQEPVVQNRILAPLTIDPSMYGPYSDRIDVGIFMK